MLILIGLYLVWNLAGMSLVIYLFIFLYINFLIKLTSPYKVSLVSFLCNRTTMTIFEISKQHASILWSIQSSGSQSAFSSLKYGCLSAFPVLITQKCVLNTRATGCLTQKSQAPRPRTFRVIPQMYMTGLDSYSQWLISLWHHPAEIQ